MTTKTTLFLLGVCVGTAGPLIAKAARPLVAFAFAGSALAYEAVCDAVESSREAYSDRIKKVWQGHKKRTDTQA